MTLSFHVAAKTTILLLLYKISKWSLVLFSKRSLLHSVSYEYEFLYQLRYIDHMHKDKFKYLYLT